jgi:ubiquinone biosynthesis protein
MDEQIGWRALVRNLRREAPYWAATLPELPRLAHRALAEDRLGALRQAAERLAAENARRNRILTGFLMIAALGVLLLALHLF